MTHLLNDNILLKKCLGYLLLARCVADMLPPRGDASLWEEVGLLHHLCPWKRNKVNSLQRYFQDFCGEEKLQWGCSN